MFKNLIICSSNQGKLREFNSIFSGIKNLSIKAISEIVPGDFDPEENGVSFSENAYIKAKAGYELVKNLNQENFLVISDDSGIEIEALNGRPGIYSGRYLKQIDGGVNGVLKELAHKTNRKCRFVCNITALDQNGTKVFETQEYWHGLISHTAKGSNGFGYDPIVVPKGFEQTVAELGKETKDKLSHRAQALAKLAKFLEDANLRTCL